MDDRIYTALITSGIGVAISIAWRVINHYRLKSECNKDNQLVVSVVSTDNKPVSETELTRQGVDARRELTKRQLEEVAVEIKNKMSASFDACVGH